MIRNNMRKGNHILLAFLLLGAWGAILCGTACAQAAQPPDALDLKTPRATVDAFVSAMTAVKAGQTDQLPVAVMCLDLEDLPQAERMPKGTQYANRLFALLEHITFNIEEVPAEAKGRECTLQLGAQGELTLNLQRDGKGFWRFSYTETLQKLDEIEANVHKDAEEEKSSAEDFADHLSSPRATMETFITGVNAAGEEGMAKALSALDLSGLGAEVRAEKGWEWAVLLKRIIDRHKYVRYHEIPNDPRRPALHVPEA